MFLLHLSKSHQLHVWHSFEHMRADTVIVNTKCMCSLIPIFFPNNHISLLLNDNFVTVTIADSCNNGNTLSLIP